MTSIEDAASETIAYYERNAERYALQTGSADLTSLRSSFCEQLALGARILDVGCGSGRDLSAFRAAGYIAEGLEPAASLAAIARLRSGCQVHLGKVEDMNFVSEFDAVWACASLLHLRREVLPGALSRIRCALKEGGIFFLSMQDGNEEEVASDGRFYARYSMDMLTAAVVRAEFSITRVWVSKDSLGDRPDILWINVLARRRQ